MEKIHLENAGQRMDGNLFIPVSAGFNPAGKHPGVILLHGLTSTEKRYIPMAQALESSGIAALTLNLRGHGTREGTLDSLSLPDNISDTTAAYDFFVAQKGVDPERIGICGSSYGSALAAAAADKRAVKSLLLRVPAAYTDKMMAMKFSAIMDDEKNIFHAISDLDKTQTIRAMSNFKGSLLIVASEKDDIIPMTIPQAYFDAAASANRKEFEVMADAPHSLSGREDLLLDFTQRMVRWFAETL
jgi:hypothetical protein